MRKTLIVFLWLIAAHVVCAQTTKLVFQPDASCGKDALLFSLNPDVSYPVHPDFLACAWTNGGTPVTTRAVLAFDLAGIPVGTTVLNATLELFHRNSTYNIGHSTLSGPNDATLYRIIQPWTENTVTWSNQPAYTTANNVSIATSTSSTQNYTLNVTVMLQDMINDPSHSFGFMFKENAESYYRSLLFATSDEVNPLLRPKLTIILDDSLALSGPCFTSVVIPDTTTSTTTTNTTSTGTNTTSTGSNTVTAHDSIDVSPGILLIPNVFTPNGDSVNDYWVVILPEEYTLLDITIYNRWGNLIFESEKSTKPWFGKTLSGEPCSDGVYFYLLRYVDEKNKEQRKAGHISLFR